MALTVCQETLKKPKRILLRLQTEKNVNRESSIDSEIDSVESCDHGNIQFDDHDKSVV